MHRQLMPDCGIVVVVRLQRVVNVIHCLASVVEQESFFRASLLTFKAIRKFSKRLSHFSQLGSSDTWSVMSNDGKGGRLDIVHGFTCTASWILFVDHATTVEQQCVLLSPMRANSIVNTCSANQSLFFQSAVVHDTRRDRSSPRRQKCGI